MPGLPHHRLAAMAADPRQQAARRLHVEADLRTGIARQHVGCKQHELTIRIDDLAVPGHHAESIAVAVERQSELAMTLRQRFDEIVQVLRHRGIGVMIGKGAVDLTIQLAYGAAQTPVELRSISPRDAVAAIDNDVEWALKPYVCNDALEVRLSDVGLAVTARAGGEPAGFDALTQALDRLSRERFARDHHLQPVVLRRIV